MDLEELVNKLRPVVGPKLDMLWLEYRLSPESRKDIESIINGLAARHLGDTSEILLPPPPEQLSSGDYPLGTIYYQEPLYPFSLREEEWIQHIGIFGRTGSGKTNVGFLIVKNLMERGKPFLIFDWKRNYRDLLGHPDFGDLLIFTVGRDISPFRFNPLIPPQGTSPSVWLKKLIEIMCHVYWLGEGVAFLLQKAIDDVYAEKGIYGSNLCTYPTFYDVKKWLEAYKARGRAAQWMDSTMRVIGTLCYGEVGRVINTDKPSPIDDLLKKSVILELDSLTNSDKIFLIESLLLWIHHYRLQQEERETFKHAILIEEAHHVLLRKKESKESIMDIIMREIRELGESIILLDQHPSLISIPSLGNTYCTIAMNLKHARDVNTIGDALLLNAEEREFLGKLEIGQAIVKLQGRCFSPFLVRFPLMKVKKGSVKDGELKRRMAGYFSVTEEISPLPQAAGDVSVIPATGIICAEQYKDGGITQDEETLLKDVILHPISGIAERYKRLGLSVRKGSGILDSLLAKGMLSITDIPVFKGRVKFLELADSGRAAMRQKGYDIQDRRSGGPVHEYWRLWAAEHFTKKGCQVELEKPIGSGKTIDIVISKKGSSAAIEIETGKSDAVENIRKCLDAGYGSVYCVAVNTLVLLQIKRKLKELWADDGKVRLVTPGELMGCDFADFKYRI
jgi:hypothetical protein